MNLNQIYSFIAITKTLNFTAAARQLDIPQSTISRQVGDLEDQLGVRLFYRTKRDVHLTDEGRAFLPYAMEMAEAAEKGTRSVRDLHDGSSGHLSIAVTAASEDRVSEYLSDFHKKHPAIVVDIETLSAGYTLVDDIGATQDLYFIYRDMLGESEEYDHLETHREPIGIVMNRDMAGELSGKPGKRTSEDPAEILKVLPSAELNLLSEEADPILYMQAMNYCRTHRFTPNLTNSFGELSSLMLSIRSGMGASFLPSSLVNEGAGGDLIFIPLDDDSYSITCIAAWKKSLLNPASKLFLDTLKNEENKTADR